MPDTRNLGLLGKNFPLKATFAAEKAARAKHLFKASALWVEKAAQEKRIE